MNRPAAFLFLLMLVVPITGLRSQEAAGDRTTPTAFEPLPAAYKDDEILPDSVSPDGRYGLIYPKEDISAGVVYPHLLLAALKPFQALMEISQDTYLKHGHNSYEVSWMKDSSAVLLKADIRWGPEKVFLVPLHDGKAGKMTELIAEVTKLVRPAYLKAKPDRFNDDFEFIFESNCYDRHGNETAENWSFDEWGNVNILCLCTNDPKDIEDKSWTVCFKGKWNTAKRKFITQELSRHSSGPHKL